MSSIAGGRAASDTISTLPRSVEPQRDAAPGTPGKVFTAVTLPLYLGGHGGFCSAAGSCLILPTWNHLWFLPYLMAYTLLLWTSVRAAPNWLDRAGNWLSHRLSLLTLLAVSLLGSPCCPASFALDTSALAI